MTQLTISEARTRLTKLANRAKKDRDAVGVTNRGKPVLAILPWDLYEALEETVEILSDDELMAGLRESITQMKNGKLIPLDQVKKNLGLE